MDSPSRFRESDPYAPLMADDLLKGLNEWRNIQDIVRLTFKALSDVVRSQGQAIHDLERQLPLKINKSEFTLALSQKANAGDLYDLQVGLDSRVPYIDYQVLSEEKVSRSDIQYLLSNKPSIEEVRNIVENRVSIKDFDTEIASLRDHIESLDREIKRKMNDAPSGKEMEYLYTLIKEKVSHDEFRDALELKANKQMVASTIQGKFEEFGDIERLILTLENKVDYGLFEQLHADVQNKVDKTDITHVLLPEIGKKAEKYELDLSIKDLRNSFERNFLENTANTEAYFNSLKAELEQTRRSINSSLIKKIESKDIEKLYSSLHKKADFDVAVEMLEKLKNECKELVNESKKELKKSEDFEFKYRLEGEISRLREQLELSNQRHKDFSDQIKSLTISLKSDTQKDLNKLHEQISYNQTTVQDLSSKRVDPHEFSSLKQLVLETQHGIDKIRENLGTSNEEFSIALKTVKEEALIRCKTLENTMFENLSQKVSLSELPKLVESKLDSSQAAKHLGIKQIQDSLAVCRQEIDRIHVDILQKCSTNDLQAHISSTEIALEDVAKDMLLKCNIKDLCTLLDMKANIDDINKALNDVHNELDSKLPLEDFNNHISDYNSIIEALCAENCLGRWLWKSGELRSGSLVPWEIQSVNTAPDNFLWEKEKISIVTVAPGLYELIIGFYARKKPTVQVLVNAEPIMPAVSNSAHAAYYGNGKARTVPTHPSGNIACLSLVEYVALPARARVSVSYSGEIQSEGFISLRKL